MNIALENNIKFENKEKLKKRIIEEEIKINLPINNSDLVNVSTTFMNITSDEPLGLDLNKFLNSNPDETLPEISYSNDLSIITQVKNY